MANPLVTVLVDTYNHERFIEEAIVSVLEQDFPRSDMEILVVDDGSTDRTAEILRKFEPEVRVLHKANGGQASAFNAGIPQARGEIIAFLDGDDWWAKNKLSRVIETMAADPSVGLVGHGIVIVREDGFEQTEALRGGFNFRANTVEGARLFRVRRSFMGTSRMTIRTGLVRTIGAVPEGIAIEADEYLFTLAAVLSHVQILGEALTYYRLHDANLYQITRADRERIARKQRVIQILAKSVAAELERLRVPEEVRRILAGTIAVEANQLRLTLGEGWPWETVKTEWFIYRMLHPDSSVAHRVFKVLSLLPALVLPPGTFYGLRSRAVRSNLYLEGRRRWLPMPRMTHIEKSLKAPH
ncbi:MAG TPA: glycosyltransferase family A protein [Candidatus Acidoferrum sp.]|nr:glycosyltransferase family A protein [Candidatus Acidoferrum sp.]